jgi:hypothetical protein
MAKLIDDSLPDLEIAPFNKYSILSFPTPFGDTVDARYTLEGLQELAVRVNHAIKCIKMASSKKGFNVIDLAQEDITEEEEENENENED